MICKHELITWTQSVAVCKLCGFVMRQSDVVADFESARKADQAKAEQQRGINWVRADVFGHTFDGAK